MIVDSPTPPQTQDVSLFRRPKVYIIGVGMTAFTKPLTSGKDYPELVKEAVGEALSDAGVRYEQIQQATASYMYGGSCCGQRALYEIGLTGIPIFNLNNACASSSSGIFLCKQIIESGNIDLMLAVGFEKVFLLKFYGGGSLYKIHLNIEYTSILETLFKNKVGHLL